MSETRMFTGIAAAPGIAIGEAFLLDEEDFCVVEVKIPESEIKKEISRYKEALNKTHQEMEATRNKIDSLLGKEYGRLAEAYQVILDDPIFNRDVIKKISSGVNAEYALYRIMEQVVKSFDLIEDEYFRERKHDIQDVGKRIMRHLMGPMRHSLAEINKPVVVVARNITPADTLTIHEGTIQGFVTDMGGKTSHAAILSQTLGIPAVVGLRNITATVKTGEMIILDGNQGIVIVNPSQEVLLNYQREKEIELKTSQELEKLRDLPAQTRDGTRFILAANIDNPQEAKLVLRYGGEGIGLYRTEFLYFNRTDLPSENEHYENYRQVARKMLPYRVIVRTVDIGGDKIASLGGMDLPPERNPFMGLRGIRLCLRYPEFFKVQLRAILRASAEGRLGIMYPMISGVEEFLAANRILAEVKEELRQRKIPFDENIPVGAMIEVPSAAMTADIIARQADFLSIGTNDLIQYTLAVDRVNENVADIYEPLHISILRLLKKIIDAGHNAGKKVAMCGEMAADPNFTAVLIGLGLDEFSVSPPAVPKIKRTIRSLELVEAQKLAEEIFNAPSRDIIIQQIKQFHIRQT